jgi:predicted CXXCH cytochrome family protein
MTEQKSDNQDAPGPLSVVHTNSPGLLNCQKCHSANMDIDDKKCLTCHTEIASRIASKKGYHRHKSEGCALCHTEHQGKKANLIVMDIRDFDHDETGYALKDGHQKVKDCSACHRKNNSVPREKTKSFLLKNSRCLSCHQSPHPGRQDQCQTCHTQKNWRVDIWSRKDTG